MVATEQDDEVGWLYFSYTKMGSEGIMCTLVYILVRQGHASLVRAWRDARSCDSVASLASVLRSAVQRRHS